MRLAWIMPFFALAVLAQSSQPHPGEIVARRLEQQSQFAQRMGRGKPTATQAQIIKWLNEKGNVHVNN